MIKCPCKFCKRDKLFLKFIKEVNSEEAIKFFNDIYDRLENIELNNQVNEAIIDGSWPSADERIKVAREKMNGTN